MNLSTALEAAEKGWVRYRARTAVERGETIAQMRALANTRGLSVLVREQDCELGEDENTPLEQDRPYWAWFKAGKKRGPAPK